MKQFEITINTGPKAGLYFADDINDRSAILNTCSRLGVYFGHERVSAREVVALISPIGHNETMGMGPANDNFVMEN